MDAIWYDCPKCGKKQASDGEHFCGKCEQEYAEAEERRAREEYKDMIRRLPEDGGGAYIPTFWEWYRGY